MAKRPLPKPLLTYRVREGRYHRCNGYRCWRERGFVAERRVYLFWLFPIWSPVRDGEWRSTRERAKADLDRDAWLRSPLSEPQIFQVN